MSNSIKNNLSSPLVSSVRNKSPENSAKNDFRNQLGQLLYLDYEISDLKNRNFTDSLSKAINKRQDLIEIIEKVENPSLKKSLKTYYIDKVANEFIDDGLRKLKSRYFQKKPCCNEQNVINTENAKKQIHEFLNNQIALTDEQLEMVISNLNDSLDRIIFRKSLIDKKNYAQIAEEISTNTFRRANNTTNVKSTLNRSTIGRRIKKYKILNTIFK